jgi:hypothetical protein
MTQAVTSWTSVTRDRIRDVQSALLTMSEWARDGQATPEQTELLLNPYREMVEALYERDIPLAKLADESDILLHVRGPSATGPSPRVSVLTRLLTSTRDQVTRLAKQIEGVTSVRVPTSLDMGFVGVAGGSLFVGFSADASTEGDSTREAVKLISQASSVVASNGSATALAQTIRDPAARDMAIAAVRHLSPSGQIGIREIEILGKQVVGQVSLTTETRRHARGIMAQRIVSTTSRNETFVGTVREVDLDASRFEIRNVEGNAEDIRCAHELEEAEVKSLVDRRVRVSGTAEYGPKGTVRLLWIDEVELLG